MNPGSDSEILPIKLNSAVTRSIFLDHSAGSPLGLIADKQNIGSLISQQRFQIVLNPPTGTHTAAGNHNTGSSCFPQIINGMQMILMAVNRR